MKSDNDKVVLQFTLTDLLALKKAQKAKAEVPAAKPAKTVKAKPIQEVVIRPGEGDCVEFVAPYNHQFRGFRFANTKAVGKPSWKWNPEKGCFVVPMSDIEILLRGVRETFHNARLHVGARVEVLP